MRDHCNQLMYSSQLFTTVPMLIYTRLNIACLWPCERILTNWDNFFFNSERKPYWRCFFRVQKYLPAKWSSSSELIYVSYVTNRSLVYLWNFWGADYILYVSPHSTLFRMDGEYIYVYLYIVVMINFVIQHVFLSQLFPPRWIVLHFVETVTNKIVIQKSFHSRSF